MAFIIAPQRAETKEKRSEDSPEKEFLRMMLRSQMG